MKRNFKIILLYGIVTIVGNYIASYTSIIVHKLIIASLIGPVILSLPRILGYLIYFLIYYPPALIVSWACIFVLFRICVPKLYKKEESKYTWLKRALKIALPGETIRYAICMNGVGLYGRTGMYALVPSDIYDNTWLKWTGRLNAVRYQGEFEFIDYLGYFIVYIPYLVLYLAVVLLIFKKFWKLGKIYKEDLVF